ncbi:unnamed protein product [Lathyrus oleraceus]|uniref:Uncharacterized protein n=1 Tax=Pisum sativum TaxID=3888 RepID=A0A9D5ADT1_PEA|nr:protein SOB FIVE-LIKE 5-like isoform X2 [Pisum sativum]KAI5404166.1 hypothetical protein KIW84_051343 [Pisum sativum]
MDMSNYSQYNSESESGWTNYLNHSSFSAKHFNSRSVDYEDYQGKGVTMEEQDEEEDLSMVSDASSGPPHYHVEEDYQQNYCVNWNHSSSSKESKKKVNDYGRKSQQSSPLDDTASSHVLNYPKKKISFSVNGAVENNNNTIDFSPCFSATRTKRKTKFQKRSLGGKQASEEPGGFNEERK